MSQLSQLIDIYAHHFPEELYESDDVWVVEQFLARGDVRGCVHLQITLEGGAGGQSKQTKPQNKLHSTPQHHGSPARCREQMCCRF